MILFVEGYCYKTEIAKSILRSFSHKVSDKGISTDCVGYCYDRNLNDCIFFAPKVICDSADLVLGEYPPERCIELDDSAVSPEDKSFLHELNIWIYRALHEYSHLKESVEILQEKHFSVAGSLGESISHTFLDVVLGLIKFYNENRGFLIYTINSIHSQNHKIDWRKTISHSHPIILDDAPIYIDPISKRKSIDWDEELMVIYFSILNYLNKYGFDLHFENQYELIKGDLFSAFKEGLGARRLRQIRHRYYSDKTRELWALCYGFFELTETIQSGKEDSDYLIATSFHVAFEAMVDELIGEPKLAKMRKLDDGKIIDHIYEDISLLSKDEIYFIGDSKYYKSGNSVEENSTSAFKQYTYARNIVHDSITQSLDNTWPFRDPLTEGYCITPNFFISAEIDPERRYDVDGFDKTDVPEKDHTSRQFINRLFDRDTLWVNQYNLNFLFLLSTYASADNGVKEDFKKKAHRFFRNQTIDLMNKKYEFWKLVPKKGEKLKDILTDTVKWTLRGTVYSIEDSSALLLAMEKPKKPEFERNEQYTDFERRRVYYEIKPTITKFFNNTRCILSKDDNKVIDSDIPLNYRNFCYSLDDE